MKFGLPAEKHAECNDFRRDWTNVDGFRQWLFFPSEIQNICPVVRNLNSWRKNMQNAMIFVPIGPIQADFRPWLFFHSKMHNFGPVIRNSNYSLKNTQVGMIFVPIGPMYADIRSWLIFSAWIYNFDPQIRNSDSLRKNMQNAMIFVQTGWRNADLRALWNSHSGITKTNQKGCVMLSWGGRGGVDMITRVMLFGLKIHLLIQNNMCSKKKKRKKILYETTCVRGNARNLFFQSIHYTKQHVFE